MKNFSIIIPCYNIAEYLDICMEHIIHQTIGFDSIEVILIDDLSDDNGQTLAKMRSYENEYPDNILLIESSQKLWPGGCRNLALKHTTGEYIAYCDADDWLRYDALELLYNIACENNCDVVEFKNTTTRIHDGACPAVGTGEGMLTTIDTPDQRKAFLLPSDSSVLSGDKIYKRELLVSNPSIRFREHGYYEEPPFSQMVRVFAKRYYTIDLALYYYYLHADSSSNTFLSRRLDMQESYLDYIRHAKEAHIYEAYQEEIDYVFWCGYYFLPLMNMAGKGYFYTADEINLFHKELRNHTHDIRRNKYFIQAFQDKLFLGDLIYKPIDEPLALDIFEFFKMLAG